jgi:membrane-associated phospholipid phosphatase
MSTAASAARLPFSGRVKAAALVLAGLAFVLCLAPPLAGMTSWTDFGVVGALNRFAQKSHFFDVIVARLAQSDMFGAALLALIWGCWFYPGRRIDRAQILVGTLASFAFGIISRGLQAVLVTHSRPFHDGMPGFVLPFGVEPDTFNAWDSFPSDHAAVYAGLALVACAARPAFGVAAMVLLVANGFTRIYSGIHFPTDILAGALLGIAGVLLSWNRLSARAGAWAASWSERTPGVFYAAAFLVSYCISTLFQEVREILSGLAHYVGG